TLGSPTIPTCSAMGRQPARRGREQQSAACLCWPRMHVEHEGPSDAPDVVLLHGGIGTGRYHWSKQVKALAADFRLHLVDLPGHGSTPLPEDRPYDRALLVDAVRGHLEDLGRPAILVGFSM